MKSSVKIKPADAWLTTVLAEDGMGEVIQKEFPELDFTEEGLEYLKNRQIPKRQTAHAAAYDLGLPYSLEIKPGEIRKLFLGWVPEILDENGEVSANTEVMVSARSSLCKKKGLILLQPYYSFVSGDILVISVLNISKEPVFIEKEERLVQVLFRASSDSDSSAHAFMSPEEIAARHYKGNISFVKSKSHLVDVLAMPMRDGGFRFQNLEDIILPPQKVTYVMTGIKWEIPNDYAIILQASDTLPSPLLMANGIGIIDADYYNNEDNEGEIGFPIVNLGYLPVKLPAGMVLGSGITKRFLVIDDDSATGVRKSGFGSTDDN